jgi:hypothetical protein
MVFVAPVYALEVRIVSDSSVSDAFAIAVVSSVLVVDGRESSSEVSEPFLAGALTWFLRRLGLIVGVGAVLLDDESRNVMV